METKLGISSRLVIAPISFVASIGFMFMSGLAFDTLGISECPCELPNGTIKIVECNIPTANACCDILSKEGVVIGCECCIIAS